MEKLKAVQTYQVGDQVNCVGFGELVLEVTAVRPVDGGADGASRASHTQEVVLSYNGEPVTVGYVSAAKINPA